MITRRFRLTSVKGSLSLCTRNTIRLQRPFGISNRAHESLENDVPWYLRKENTSSPSAVLEQTVEPELANIPENLPAQVNDLLKVIIGQYGMTDLEVFDLSTLPADHPRSLERQNDEQYVIIVSGKSEKHIFKASYDLKQHAKHKLGCQCWVEGMVNNAVRPVERRRLAKRARQGPPATHNTFGIGANTWVRCGLGAEGIVVHMMSAERRAELNLESFYQDKEEQVPKGEEEEAAAQENKTGREGSSGNHLDKESIFFGLKRSFHTCTQSQNAALLNSILEQTLSGTETDDFVEQRLRFDEVFQGTTIEEHNAKFEFYKALHLLGTGTSFADVEKALLDKHSSLALLAEPVDWNQEVLDDVIKYMQLLIDTKTGLSSSDKLDKLSSLIHRITIFSSDDIAFFSVDKFQTLLWHLTLEDYPALDVSYVNSVIESQGKSLKIDGASTAQNYQGARDVRDLIRHVNHAKEGHVPVWLRQQMLQTYAQTKNWEYFWQEMNAILQSLTTPQEFVHFYLRVIILLASMNDYLALREFFGKYWNNPDEHSNSFVPMWNKNNQAFGDNDVKLALKETLMRIQHGHGQYKWYDEVYKFALDM
ncbi:uncharacterized protein LODBEIA_P08260 [Lodderomyces beijingensis]|uniref:ATPase synthesis protein 25 n=1 Tax=Lodderomyces beijingensis TaxID=1775926 RepID=A0ABP0ZKB5_9ASCO